MFFFVFRLLLVIAFLGAVLAGSNEEPVDIKPLEDVKPIDFKPPEDVEPIDFKPVEDEEPIDFMPEE
ncbi:hypothetical protein Aduo_007321 [Ancylostoma duodenale]